MTLSFQLVDPRLLKSNPWNTNIVSAENERKLDESMRRLGTFKPVLVREVSRPYLGEELRFRGTIVKSLEILGGEHRVESAIRLGLTEIPIVNLGSIDDQKAKEIGLADNSRYGVDDTLGLAELMKGLGSVEQLSGFLPWTSNDIETMISSVTIDLDALSLTENIIADAEAEKSAPRTPKTHAIMRFKVPLGDHERIAAIIAKTQKEHGFMAADDLTNAGDALVHLLLGEIEE